jgi:cell division septum initiation protein DivIVA
MTPEELQTENQKLRDKNHELYDQALTWAESSSTATDKLYAAQAQVAELEKYKAAYEDLIGRLRHRDESILAGQKQWRESGGLAEDPPEGATT